MIAQARATAPLPGCSRQTNAKPGFEARAVRATLNNAGRVSSEDFVLSSPLLEMLTGGVEKPFPVGGQRMEAALQFGQGRKLILDLLTTLGLSL